MMMKVKNYFINHDFILSANVNYIFDIKKIVTNVCILEHLL